LFGQLGVELIGAQAARAGFGCEPEFGEEEFLGGAQAYLVYVEQQGQDGGGDEGEQAGDAGGG